MNEYRLRSTGEVVTEQALRFSQPDNVTLPAVIDAATQDALGVDAVMATPAPQGQPGKQVLRDGVVQDSLGNWVWAWKIEDIPAEVLAAALAAAKTAKLDEINKARLAANTTSFPYAGKQIACDALSRSDIDGTNGYVLLNGTFPPSWPSGWKALDNSYVAITTIDEWKAFYGAMCAAGTANFAKAQTLKAQVDAATTVEEVNAIRWAE